MNKKDEEIRFVRINKSEIGIENYDGTLSCVKIRVRSVDNSVSLEFQDFYGEMTIKDLEQILVEMWKLNKIKSI